MRVRGAVVGLLVGLLVVVPSAWADNHSSTFQVGSGHMGYLYGAGVVPPLTRSWSINLGWSNQYEAIDAGRVFAFARPATRGSSAELDAISLSTGKVVWSQSVNDTSPVYLDLAVSQGEVFAAVDGVDQATDTTEIFLYAFNESTGAQIWKEPLRDESFPSVLTPAAGTLYLDGDGLGSVFYAINETSGAIRWQVHVNTGNPVTVVGSTVVSSTPCGAWGLSASTGSILWADTPSCDAGGTLESSYDGAGHVWGDNPVGGGLGQILAVSTGQILGHFPGWAPAFGYGEAVQVALTSGGVPEVRAFYPGTQTTLWTLPESTSSSAPGSLPLLADGYVFAESPQGTVLGLAPCTGSVAWQGSAGSPAPSGSYDPLLGLAAGNGYLVVPIQGGLAAFRGSGNPSGPPPVCG
jgi:outer membrane protein assembly factor BamB